MGGRVQGVGYRAFVFNLAERFCLCGVVQNLFLRFEQFKHGFGELGSRRPGFVHARAGENICAAAAFANPRVAVPDKMRFAAAA